MHSSKKRVYILDAQSLTALTTARAIQGEYDCVGIYLKGCESYSSILSKVWNELIPVSDLSAETVNLLIVLAEDHTQRFGEKPLLLTATDDGVLFLSENEKALSAFYSIPIPEQKAVNTLMDKSLFYQWAEEHQLPIINTRLCETQIDLIQSIKTFPLPFILKPKVRMHLWNLRFPQEKIITITTEDQREKLLADRINLFSEMGGMIIQKLIPGGDENIYFVLVAFDMNGNLKGSFAGQKLAQWPPRGGSTLVCVGSKNPVLTTLANEMFALLPMKGLASVEYKQCSETGNFYIIEPTVGRCDHQSLIAEYCNYHLVLALVDSVLNPTANKITKHTEVKRIWIDEISFVRLLRSDIKLALHVISLMGYINLWRLRPLLFRMFDAKPFVKSLSNLLGLGKK